ncbi:MAG TPA: TM1812 family CRISPR-associated protein [Roseiflexaceae bacterium]|nr:TM1812 family CRISPR-associated protein [Roseiflexaceae bacterium]
MYGSQTPKTEADVWTMFDTITAIIQLGDEIILDVTLSFRSIPILALIAGTYLRVARQAKLKLLTYAEVTAGAYDAPLRDLTGFMNLLDWTSAADSFVRHGRFSEVNLLLESHGADRPLLVTAAEHMSLLARALLMTRPVLTMQTAHALTETIRRLAAETPNNSGPFDVLLAHIKKEYDPLALEQPLAQDQATRREVLDRTLRMVKWYLDKDLPINAMTLAREWLVSIVVYYQNGDLFDDRRSFGRGAPGARERAEELINRGTPATLPRDDPLYQMLPKIQSLWKRVAEDPTFQQAADLRNDLAHAGMRRQARHPDAIAEAVRGICHQLEDFLRPPPEE